MFEVAICDLKRRWLDGAGPQELSFGRGANPMRRRRDAAVGSDIKARIAAKTSWNRSSVRRSNSSSLRAISPWGARACRIRTKARTTRTLAAMARGELSTLAAMIAPCSVKAKGRVRRPPRPRLRSQSATSNRRSRARSIETRNRRGSGGGCVSPARSAVWSRRRRSRAGLRAPRSRATRRWWRSSRPAARTW